MRKFFFITGLPRSGSTLLAAILNQNPDIQSGMSTPVAPLTSAVRLMMSRNNEIDALIDDAGRRRILKGIFEAYYSHLPENVIVFDTSRSWSSRIPELLALMDNDIRLIATVRNPAWVFDSVERIVRQNPLRQSGMVAPGASIESRAKQMMQPDGFIGAPLGYLKEALASPESVRLLLVEYDALCLEPQNTLDAIYQFTGLPPFQHDFSWVEYEQEAFDTALRTPGLHRVKGPVELKPRKTRLPQDIFDILSREAFWRNGLESDASRILVKSSTLPVEADTHLGSGGSRRSCA